MYAIYQTDFHHVHNSMFHIT